MSSNPDPLDSATRGATKGFLDWTAEKVKELVIKLRDRKIAFVADVETVRIAREQRKTSEWIIFRDNVSDSDLRILFQMGLTLRKLENEGQSIHPLRQKIFKKYGKKGLHVAQVVQNGTFSRYYGSILEKAATPEKLRAEILDLFTNVDNRVIFVQKIDKVKKKADLIVTKLNANSPDTFVISGYGNAKEICKKIHNEVMQRISGYESELYKSDIKRIYFLNKKQTIDD